MKHYKTKVYVSEMQRFTGNRFELRQYENEWILSIKRVVIYRWLKAWFACTFFACTSVDN